MEKDPEITGQEGSHYTAAFWEYDTRIARRWNVDPVVKYHESPYATFANNPIWFIDVMGADSTTYIWSARDADGNPMYTKDELQEMADMSEFIDRENGINYTQYQVFGTFEDFLEAQNNGDVSINRFTDIYMEISSDNYYSRGLQNSGGVCTYCRWGEKYCLNNANNGIDGLYGGVVYGGEFSNLTLSERHANIGRNIGHERLAHAYMFNLDDIAGDGIKMFSYDGGLDDGLISPIAIYLSGPYTELRGTESISTHRKVYLNLLFMYGAGKLNRAQVKRYIDAYNRKISTLNSRNEK
jgi:hypothetical protein